MEVAAVSTPVHVRKDRELAQMRKQVGELNAQLDSMNFELDEARLAKEEAEAEAEAAKQAKREAKGAEEAQEEAKRAANGVAAAATATAATAAAAAAPVERADAVTETEVLTVTETGAQAQGQTEEVGVETEGQGRAEVAEQGTQSDEVVDESVRVRAMLEAEMADKVREAVESASGEARAAQEKAAKAGKAAEEAERMMSVKNEVIDKLQGDLDASLERLDVVEEELKVAEAGQEERKARVGVLESRVAELEAEVAAMQAGIVESEGEKMRLAKGMARLCHKHTGIKLLPGGEDAEEDEEEDEHVKAMRVDLEGVKAELDQARSELEGAYAQSESRGQEVAALTKGQAALVEEHEGLKAELEGLKTLHGGLKAEHERLQDEHSGMTAKYQELRAEHDALTEEHEGLKSRMENSATQSGDADEVARLKKELEAKESEIAALESEEERVSLEAAERVDAARSKAEYAQAKLEIVRGQLSEAKESVAELQREVAGLRSGGGPQDEGSSSDGGESSLVRELRSQLASARDAAEASEVRAFQAGVERDAMERKLEAMASDARDGIAERNEALRCQQELVEKVKAECDTYAGEVRRLSISGGGGSPTSGRLRELEASNESLQESVRLQSLSSATLLQRLGAAQVELGGVSTERNMLRALLQEASNLLLPLDHGKEVHLGLLRDTIKDGLSAIGRAHEANAMQRRYSLPASKGGMGPSRMGVLPHTPMAPPTARPVPQTASRTSASPKSTLL